MGVRTLRFPNPQTMHTHLQGYKAAPGFIHPYMPILAYSGQLLSIWTPGQAKDLGTNKGIMEASALRAGPLPLQLSYLVLMALQPQLLSSSLKVPDANGQVIGSGSKHVSSQGMETQRVDLFCVA